MTNPFQPKRLNVPGLLSDEVINEQLKQFSSQQNALENAAPPPDSAVDMVDRIQKEYLSKPSVSLRTAGAALPGPLGSMAMLGAGMGGEAAPAAPNPVDGQQRAIDVRSDILSEAVGGDSLGSQVFKSLVTGTPIGALIGDTPLTRSGTLQTPEQREAEAQVQADDAKANLEAATSQADTREKLRNLTDEEAARLGMPSAPGGVQPEVKEEAAKRDADVVAEATKRNTEAIAATKDPAKQPTQTWWLDAMQSGAKGAAQMGIGTARFGTEVAEMARDITGVDLLTGGGRSTARAWVDTVDATVTKLLPGDKTRSKEFVHQLAQGSGSMAGFMIGGYVGATFGLPVKASTMILGAATQGDQQFRDAEAFQANGLQKYLALIAGAALGTSEAIPIDRMFFRADAMTGGLVRRMLNNTSAASVQEFMQEFGQAVGQDVVARLVYDEKRKFDVTGYIQQGVIGAVTGGLAGAATTALSNSGVSARPADATPSEQRQIIGQTVIDQLQRQFDARPAEEGVVPEALANIAASEAPAAQQVLEGPGGTVPVNEAGKFEAHHESGQQLETIDPAFRGTGPLRGGERQRLFGPDAVDRSYFGVGDPNFVRGKDQQYKLDTDPYHGEGLGPLRHTIEADPATIYNWFEDPLNLKSQLDRSTPPSEQVTRYEKLIKDAGFKGVYFSSSPLGQTAAIFEATKPSRVVDTRFDLPPGEIATPADFENATPQTFAEKGGWAVVTATQEAVGDASAPENIAANEKLRNELKKKGIKFQEVGGVYQGTDQGKSFLVFMPEKQAVALGKKYKQESVLTRRGLEYSDGRLVPAVPEQTVVGEAAKQNDFYSTLPGGQAFSIGLDFGASDADPDLLAKIDTPQRVKQLTEQVPGLKGAMKHMTPDEQAKLSKANAAKIVDIFTNLPDPKEMAAVAFSGRAKRGWYQRSAEALVNIFGLQDAPRFAGLLAALSPQTSVESNAVNALTMWANWLKAGRPIDEASIRKLLGKSVQGGKGEASVLPSWVNNSVTALAEPDAMSITLSGPKVDSFMKNLQGKVVEVTNDAWMANFANVDQSLFKKTGAAPGKSSGYVAMSAAVRNAAAVATKLTGQSWTPAEVQETVWSWVKTLYEKASAAGENRTAREIIAAGDMTAAEISATPDFASLFVGGVYRKLLEAGGYDVDAIASSSGQPDAGDTAGSSPLSAEGSGFAQAAFDRHLGRAARRLDDLRARRAQAEQDTSVTTDETFFPDGGAARQTELDQLSDDDRAFLDEGLLANLPPEGDLVRPAAGIPGPSAVADTGDINLRNIGDNFTKAMDLTVRQGRLTLKGGAVGQYSRKTAVVRVKATGDVSTLVHEGGHDLYFSGGAGITAFAAANETLLMKVADDLYGGDTNTLKRSTHIAEGFAEFFRVYTLNRKYAESHFPPLVAEFDAVLDRDAPQLRQDLALIGQQYMAWMQMPSAQLMRNMIVSGQRDGTINAAMKDLAEAGFGTWMHEYARNAVDASVNRFASLSDLVTQVRNVAQENTGQALDLSRAEDPYILMRMAGNTGARAQVQLTDGVMAYNSTEPSSRSLREAMLRYHGKTVDQNLFSIEPERQADFAAYLVALRAIDEFRRLAEGKISKMPLGPKVQLGEPTTTVAEMEAKYGTDFSEAAEIVHEYGMALWEKGFDAGLMSEETYLDGLDRQFYAPLQRDMSDKKASFGPSALTGAARLVKRFKGSDRNIVDPMDVLMHKTFALEKIINRNEVFRTLGLLADRAGKAGALIERVPATQLIGKQLSVKEVARSLTKDDTLTLADAQDLMDILGASIENENVIDMFRSETVQTKGENIIFGWDKGKLAALQLADGDLGADVVNVVNGLGKENLPLFTGIISSTTSIFRAGIVSWPDFLVANFIKDQFSAFILTDVGFKPFVTGLRGVFDELRQSNRSKSYNATMGIMGGMNVANLHNARIDRDIKALKAKGYLTKAFNKGGFRGALTGIASIIELTETGTRLGVYGGAYNRAKKDGLSDWDASVEASYTATDMMDFGLNGSRMMLYRKTIPFLNAQLQGLYKMMRTLGADEVRQRKGLNFVLRSYFKSTHNLELSRTEKQAINVGRKAWVKMASLGLISAALHFMFRDDEDYQEAGEYLRATGWVIPMGDGRLFYIPKPYELALLANFTERALEAGEGDDAALGRFMRGVSLTLVPPTAPPVLQTGVELLANKDFFTDREIVPSYMRALDPQLQFNAYTSKLAKQLGAVTGMSPLKIDHVMAGLGATAYRDIMTMYNTTDPNRGNMDATDAPILRRFVRDVRRGSTSSRDFWGLASTVNGSLRSAEASYKKFLEQGNENAANDFLSGLGEDEKAYALLTTHFKAEVKRLNPFYRGRQLTSIVSGMRREMVSELGLEDTTTKIGAPITLTSKEKGDLDEAMSEYARREMRNTLVAMRAPGWAGKKMVDTQTTLDLIGRIEPRAREELQRRIDKAKVYNFKVVNEYWPEVKNRLLSDRENTFLDDILSIAKAMP